MAQERFSAISTCFTVRDVNRTVAFYSKLGFTTGNVMPGPDGKAFHADMHYNGSTVMFGPSCEGDYEGLGKGIGLYIDVPNCDAAYQRAKEAGVTIVEEPKDQFWGHRDFTVADPDGYKLTFSQFVRKVTPEEMKQAMLAMAQ